MPRLMSEMIIANEYMARINGTEMKFDRRAGDWLSRKILQSQQMNQLHSAVIA